MIHPFDIFRTEIDDSVCWLESAATLEEAQARVQELARHSPGEYVVLNYKTGNKLVINLKNIDTPLVDIER